MLRCAFVGVIAANDRNAAIHRNVDYGRCVMFWFSQLEYTMVFVVLWEDFIYGLMYIQIDVWFMV